MNTEAGRQAKFNQLAEAYGADLYRYAMWICGNDALAKDLVQETFLRAWKALDRLKDIKAAKSWLITILRREYARTFERKVPKFTDVETVVVTEDSELEPEDRTEIRLLRQSILTLAPKYREPLMMQVVLGYSCQEISEALDISKSAVMTQLFRAREQLKSNCKKMELLAMSMNFSEFKRITGSRAPQRGSGVSACPSVLARIRAGRRRGRAV